MEASLCNLHEPEPCYGTPPGAGHPAWCQIKTGLLETFPQLVGISQCVGRFRELVAKNSGWIWGRRKILKGYSRGGGRRVMSSRSASATLLGKVSKVGQWVMVFVANLF